LLNLQRSLAIFKNVFKKSEIVNASIIIQFSQTLKLAKKYF
jgi:hypothetical protein